MAQFWAFWLKTGVDMVYLRLCFGSNVTFLSGPIQGQLWVINLAETWASYGPCLESRPVL